MRDDETEASSSGTNKATLRTLNVLSAYISRTAPYGVTELSNDRGMTKNMAFRALTTLLEHGYTVRDADGSRYDLGYGVLWLQGAGADEELDIRAVCAPFLQRCHEATGESAFLSVIVGRNHVTIDSVEAHGVRVSHRRRGLLVPLHASPASRVLLSFLSDDEIAEYIRVASPLKRFTPTTIARADKLWDEVRKVRRQGFARGYGDHYAHANYVSFPVLDVTGRPHAAITIGGPPDRLSKKRIEALLPELLRITMTLNEQTRLYPSSATVLFG